MKLFLPIALGVVCIALVVFLMKTTKADHARHDADVATIASYSNRLDAAESELNARGGTILTLSNRLEASGSAALTLSNQLANVQSAAQMQSEQITNLNQQLAVVTAEKLALAAQRVNLTNQVGLLTGKLAQKETALVQAGQNYAALENRFRIDVAERLVLQRKFYNPEALQVQMEKLKSHLGMFDVTADQIYASLGVEVQSNGTVHVITPD